jgi:GT2 family glycosyltransferase
MNDRIFVVVLNYNKTLLTEQCINSCLTLKSKHEIILVDNCSTDKSYRQIKVDNPEVVLLENQENLGYAGGNNVGIRYALEHDADYILVLNNDTIVPSNLLEVLKSEIEKDKTIGAISPVIFCQNGKDIWYAGAEINYSNGDTTHINKLNHFYTSVLETDYVSGCAMMISAEKIRKIGLFNERYFLMYEEVDWCLRARDAGLKCVVTNKTSITHFVSSSTVVGSAIYDYYTCRNSFWLIKTHKRMFLSDALLKAALLWVKRVIGFLRQLKIKNAVVITNGLLEGILKSN